MSAFGRKLGQASARTGFGTARPAGNAPAGADEASFSPEPVAVDNNMTEVAPLPGQMSEPAPHLSHAMARLAEREAASGDAGVSQHGGFEASVHRIKEQVLPRLLERVAPEEAATLSKEELTEEFRQIIGAQSNKLRVGKEWV